MEKEITMEAKEISQSRIFLFVLASLIFVFAILDSLFFKINDGYGTIGLGICAIAIAISANSMNSKEQKQFKLNPKTEKIFISIALFLIVSGLITAIVVA